MCLYDVHSYNSVIILRVLAHFYVYLWSYCYCRKRFRFGSTMESLVYGLLSVWNSPTYRGCFRVTLLLIAQVILCVVC